MCLPATKPVRTHKVEVRGDEVYLFPGVPRHVLTGHFESSELLVRGVPHGAQWASARCRARPYGTTESDRWIQKTQALGKTSLQLQEVRMSVAMPRTTTRGVLFVHGAPAALCPHITWAIEAVLDQRVTLDWIPQPAAPRLVRTELSWTGAPGTGAELASALRGWDGLRYEVTEDPSAGCDGARWSYTPRLGIHHAMTSASGDAVVPRGPPPRGDRCAHAAMPRRSRTRSTCCSASRGTKSSRSFRYAGDGAPVRWLHKVG